MHFSAFFLFFVCALISVFYCYLVIIDVCSGQKEKLIKCYIIALAVIFQTESKKTRENKKNKLLPESSPSGIKLHGLVMKRSLRF